jgi:hypothetical protein
MRFLTSLSLIAVALPLTLVAGTGSSSIIARAYAKSSRHDTGHGAGYQAPADDKKLNCKQLSGRVQVLILQLRGYGDRKQASGLARGLQSAFSATVGTTATGADPAGEHAADLKRLQDYNQRLVASGCNSYDLDYELKQTDPLVSPSARIPPPKKTKVPSAAPQKTQP